MSSALSICQSPCKPTSPAHTGASVWGALALPNPMPAQPSLLGSLQASTHPVGSPQGQLWPDTGTRFPHPEAADLACKPRAQTAGWAMSQRPAVVLGSFHLFPLVPTDRTDQNRMELEAGQEQGSWEARNLFGRLLCGLSAPWEPGGPGITNTGTRTAQLLLQRRATAHWGPRTVPATAAVHLPHLRPTIPESESPVKSVLVSPLLLPHQDRQLHQLEA